MPVHRTKLDDADVRDELARRGYGFHLQAGYAITLNMADVESGRRESGHSKRRPMVPITHPKYDRILTFAESVNEAANQVEALSHGRVTDPHLPAEHGTQPSMDSEAIERIAKARADHAVAAATARQEQAVAALAQENKSLRETAARLLAEMAANKPKKRGRPPKVKTETPTEAQPPA